MSHTRVLAYLALSLFVTCLIGPLVLYVCTFGTHISSSHQQWAEFGSYISGIYSPLLTFATIIVLGFQVALQSRQTALQQQINDHERDQAYLIRAHSDIEFYATRMEVVLKSTSFHEVTLRSHLHKHFQPTSVEDLDSIELRQLAANMHYSIPATLDLWAAVYPILMGLDAGKKKIMFNLAYDSSAQKLIALLGVESCVALDNFHRVLSEGRFKEIKYVFSPLLCEK